MIGLVTGGQNRGLLRERCAEMAKRCGDLSPIAEPVRKRLWEGNKAAILAGVSPDGRQVAKTWRQMNAESQWMTRRLASGKVVRFKMLGYREGGDGPARAPHRERSRSVTTYQVNVIAGPQKLTFTGGYPDFEPIMGYLDKGTRYMPARPTMGFRQEDLDWIRNEMRQYVTGWRGWVARVFG